MSPNYDTLDLKILTQCVKLLGERVLQVWWWYLHWFRRYRKKTRGGGAGNTPPPSGARPESKTASRPGRVWKYACRRGARCDPVPHSCVVGRVPTCMPSPSAHRPEHRPEESVPPRCRRSMWHWCVPGTATSALDGFNYCKHPGTHKPTHSYFQTDDIF